MNLSLFTKFLLLSVVILCCITLVSVQTVAQSTDENQNDDQHRQLQVYSNSLSRDISTQTLQALPVARLRRFLTERNADCNGCVDKHDLVERAVEVMRWPTRDDSIATELSLEQDLMGPLTPSAPGQHYGDTDRGELTAIPIGEDKSLFQDMSADEPLGQSPAARSSTEPLTDLEVVRLLELYTMRLLIQEGHARCGPKFLNGTQYCTPTHAVISKEVM